MSKAFEQWWEEFTSAHDEWRFADSDALRKAAWNAATENAASVCDSKETEWDNEDRAQSAAAFHLAEAIRKEKTE